MSDTVNNEHFRLDWDALNEQLQNGMELLFRAYHYACETERDVWQFAVEWKELKRIGLASCDVRWLIAQGCALHAIEFERTGDDRMFRPATANELGKRSCFVLSESAHEVLHSHWEGRAVATNGSPGPAGNGERNGRPPAESRDDEDDDQLNDAKPEWDPDRKELRISGAVVKRFKWPAVNQELILAVFEEEGWPARIDDPLPSVPEQDPKRRLHDTIKCLNRNQDKKLIHFRGDGTGEGVVWERRTEKRRPRCG
jgi:hypothetical protein